MRRNHDQLGAGLFGNHTSPLGCSLEGSGNLATGRENAGVGRWVQIHHNVLSLIKTGVEPLLS